MVSFVDPSGAASAKISEFVAKVAPQWEAFGSPWAPLGLFWRAGAPFGAHLGCFGETF